MAATPSPRDPVSVTELNQQTSAVLKRVKAGQTLAIIERGRVVAYLSPPLPTPTGDPIIDQWIAEGRILPQKVPGSILDLLPIPPAVEGEPSLADAVIAERDREAGQE
jgi:antitoxin (DNA-binding transcriptional repressor) of toxin-antitoxin stability system